MKKPQPGSGGGGRRCLVEAYVTWTIQVFQLAPFLLVGLRLGCLAVLRGLFLGVRVAGVQGLRTAVVLLWSP